MVLPPRQFQFSHTLAVPLRPLGLGRKSQVDLERGRNSLPERLHEASEPHLLYLHGPKNGPVTAATVYLSTLQRMCLHDLRAELVDVVSQIFREKRATKQMMDDARDLLQKFSTASSPVSCNSLWDSTHIFTSLKQAVCATTIT